ncbi:hypothetical protein CcCBS67573_g00628 [Chytriomyces confervae]|uniref:Glycosyltransferase 61 catalytic domain-containing protein n=1 Tax=Chytriomyces confervae TaxID=246404 RepID=A0A507FP96_9FUNG|nr:hypothetical protein CcCBS67573_g00628 [Chytriomyces confervae]
MAVKMLPSLIAVVVCFARIAFAIPHHELEDIFAQAKTAFADANYPLAVKHFRTLKELLPDWKDNYINLASAELQTGNVNAMLQVYKEAVSKFSSDGPIHSRYCELLAKTGDMADVERPEDGIQACERAVSLEPRLKSNYLYSAETLKLAGRVNQALVVYAKADALFPEDAEILRPYCAYIADIMDAFFNHPTARLPPNGYEICAKVAEMLPEDSDILQKLAVALKVGMQHEAAIAVYELWLQKFGDRNLKDTIHIKATLAKTLINGGKRDRADELAKECLAAERSRSHLNAAALVRAIGWPYDRLGWELQVEETDATINSIKIRNEKMCPSGKWRIALNYTEEAELHPDRLSITFLNSDTAHQTYGRTDDPIFIGPLVPKYPHLFLEKAVYLVLFKKDVFLTGLNGVVHADCTVYAGSHHANIGLQTFPMTDDTPIVEIHDRAVSIMLHQMQNYYHWVAEALPKLLLLKEHVLDKPEYKDVKVIVPSKGVAKTLEDTLGMEEFAFLKDRLITFANPTTTRYHFTKGLFVVDWVHARDDVHGTLAESQWAVYWPPKHVHSIVRPFFHAALRKRGTFPDVTAASTNDQTIVYVQRKGGVRSFANEDQVCAYLSERFGNRLLIHTGGEGLLRQVAVFAKARVVVGNHGAGLTNFMFTQPGAVLVTIPKDPMVDFCFANMVAGMGERHFVVSEIPGAHYVGSYPALSAKHMELLGNVIENAYEMSSVGEVGEHDEL